MDFNEIKSILSDKISFQIISMTVLFLLEKNVQRHYNVENHVEHVQYYYGLSSIDDFQLHSVMELYLEYNSMILFIKVFIKVLFYGLSPA